MALTLNHSTTTVPLKSRAASGRRTMTRVRYSASSPGVAVQAPSSGVSTASKRVAVPATRNSSWT